MPTLSIDLTNAQAQRVAAALGTTTNAEALAAIKALIKDRVKNYEAKQDSLAAFDAALAKVDTDFTGF